MASPALPRPENLALLHQEILTVTVRLRANRQAVSDPEAFRAQIREALRRAEQDSRSRGYSEEQTRLARLATVAFLDESVLASRNPILADWPRKPLQEEMFGGHVAGETFFQHLDRLLAQDDSETLADVLEIFYLCLLLGYAGRYSVAGRGELRDVKERVAAKIRRIRGDSMVFSPDWAPQEQAVVRSQSDPWVKRLMVAAIVCLVLAVALFAAFKLSLSSSTGQVHSIAAKGV